MTYITGYETPKKHPNIRVVFVPDVNVLEKVPSYFNTSSHKALTKIYGELQEICLRALAYEGVQSIKNEKFDLVILYAAFTECFLSFVHKLKVCCFLYR